MEGGAYIHHPPIGISAWRFGQQKKRTTQISLRRYYVCYSAYGMFHSHETTEPFPSSHTRGTAMIEFSSVCAFERQSCNSLSPAVSPTIQRRSQQIVFVKIGCRAGHISGSTRNVALTAIKPQRNPLGILPAVGTYSGYRRNSVNGPPPGHPWDEALVVASRSQRVLLIPNTCMFHLYS